MSTGHNQPPDMTVTAGEVAKDLSGWMAENPVIETEGQAREAKLWNDRAYLCIKDLEDERKEQTRPLREREEHINAHYRAPRDLLQRVLDSLKARMDSFLQAEEAKRRAAAEEAKRLAQEAEERARAAEQRAINAHVEADSGVLGVEFAAILAEAQEAGAEAGKAARQAALAEKETHVKIGGGFRRASSLREVEKLSIQDPIEVLREVGVTDDIADALLKAARAFKRLHGRHPKGIAVTLERRT